MKLFFVLIIFLTLNNCSFDNKTGIWKNENNNFKEDKKIFKDFKKITIFEDSFNELISLDEKIKIKFSNPTNNLDWKDSLYNFNNNQKNFGYNDNNRLVLKSKKLTKHHINKYILYNNNEVILNDYKGNIIIYSINEKKIINKFNFYKKKYKNLEKKINLIIEKNILYVSDNLGYLYAFNYMTSEVIWAKNYKVPFRSNLKIIDDKLIASNQNNNLYFFDKNNGEMIKFIPTEETIVKNQFVNNLSITDEKNLLFLNTYGSLYLVDTDTTKLIWFINLNQSTDINPSNLFVGQEVVNYGNKILVSSNNRTLILDKNSGSIIKKFEFAALVRPIINRNYALFISKNNLLICVDLNTNKILYSSSIDAQISNFLNIKKKESIIKSFSLINDEILIFLKNSYVLSFNNNGVIKSVRKLPSKLNSFPIFIDNSMYYLNNKKKLIVLN